MPTPPFLQSLELPARISLHYVMCNLSSLGGIEDFNNVSEFVLCVIEFVLCVIEIVLCVIEFVLCAISFQ